MNLWRQYTLASRLCPDDRPITDKDLATLSLQATLLAHARLPVNTSFKEDSDSIDNDTSSRQR